eukprot:977404-Rhodomonas_salina.1
MATLQQSLTLISPEAIWKGTQHPHAERRCVCAVAPGCLLAGRWCNACTITTGTPTGCWRSLGAWLRTPQLAPDSCRPAQTGSTQRWRGSCGCTAERKAIGGTTRSGLTLSWTKSL